MIRILLDECLPVKLKYRFQEINPEYQVSTVTDQGWTGIKNRKLHEKADQKFDVFITTDQNLPYQQKLSKYSIAIVALKAKSNRYKDLLDFVELASSKFNWEMQGMPMVDHGYTLAITTPMKEDQTHEEKGAINGGMFKRSEELQGISGHFGDGCIGPGYG